MNVLTRIEYLDQMEAAQRYLVGKTQRLRHQ